LLSYVACLLSLCLSIACAHTTTSVNRSKWEPLWLVLCLPGSSDCSRTKPRLTSIRLSSQSIPSIKLVEQAGGGRSFGSLRISFVSVCKTFFSR
jgi:hypothetical protein